MNSVTGSAAFGGVTDYASNPQYRAWGGLKSLTYGNQTQMQMTYNNALQAAHYELNKIGQTPAIMSKNYDYNADGSLKQLTDLVDNRFDRLNTYDQSGRVKAEPKPEAERSRKRICRSNCRIDKATATTNSTI